MKKPTPRGVGFLLSPLVADAYFFFAGGGTGARPPRLRPKNWYSLVQ
jgi:hypothetical protein